MTTSLLATSRRNASLARPAGRGRASPSASRGCTRRSRTPSSTGPSTTSVRGNSVRMLSHARGDSILMTSAPISPSIFVAYGPAHIMVRSRTRTPASGSRFTTAPPRRRRTSAASTSSTVAVTTGGRATQSRPGNGRPGSRPSGPSSKKPRSIERLVGDELGRRAHGADRQLVRRAEGDELVLRPLEHEHEHVGHQLVAELHALRRVHATAARARGRAGRAAPAAGARGSTRRPTRRRPGTRPTRRAACCRCARRAGPRTPTPPRSTPASTPRTPAARCR